MTRPAPPPIPLQAGERAMSLAFLDYYRAALVDRALELPPGGLNTSHPPSTLTLARLIGHMTWVEYTWFRDRFAGQDMPEPFSKLDWASDRDAEMTLAEALPIDALLARFRAAVDDSRHRVEEADSLDQLSVRSNAESEQWSLRWIVIHMIEEYARHCGHADLIRESIDGDVAG